LSKFFVWSEEIQTLTVDGLKPMVSCGLQLCQFRRFVFGQPPVMPLVDQREPSRIQLAPRLGLIGKLRGSVQNLESPLL
jgi:hypothetical protein